MRHESWLVSVRLFIESDIPVHVSNLVDRLDAHGTLFRNAPLGRRIKPLLVFGVKIEKGTIVTDLLGERLVTLRASFMGLL